MLSEDLYKLTEISICSRVDGLHENSRVIGYVALHPFAVLSDILTEYFVCGYNGTLYPMYMVQYEHALSIRDAGDRYSPNNMDKFQYHDLEKMFSLPDFRLADIEHSIQDYKNEYIKMLNNIKINSPIIQKAINLNIIPSIANREGSTQELLQLLVSNMSNNDSETLLLAERAFHNIIR